MATIVTKFSDYRIQSIEYFIEQIESGLNYRDIPGIFLDNDDRRSIIEKINVTKQHPLVSLVAASLNDVSRTPDLFRSGILPAISVTPGNVPDDVFTLGKSPTTEIVDDDFIDSLKVFLEKTTEEIQEDMLITKNQIETIIGEYNSHPASGTNSGTRVEVHEWNKNEEINISVWSDSADIDIILGNIMDSILSDIQVGNFGDDSKIRNMKYTVSKGLTNFNFGRVIFGSEYNLTFLNTFRNYTIYTDDIVTGHEFYGTFRVPEGEY